MLRLLGRRTVASVGRRLVLARAGGRSSSRPPVAPRRFFSEQPPHSQNPQNASQLPPGQNHPQHPQHHMSGERVREAASKTLQLYRDMEDYLRWRGYNTLAISVAGLASVGLVLYLYREKVRENISDELVTVTRRTLEDNELKDQAHQLTKAIVQALLDDPNVTALCSRFLVMLFSMPDTRNATVTLLNNVLRDPETLNQAQQFFGWVAGWLAKDPNTQASLAQLAQWIIAQPSTREVTVELGRQVLADPVTRNQAALLVADLLQTDVVREHAVQLGQDTTHQVLDDERVQQHTVDFFTSCFNSPEFQRSGGKALKGAIFYSFTPSFGLPGWRSSGSSNGETKPENKPEAKAETKPDATNETNKTEADEKQKIEATQTLTPAAAATPAAVAEQAKPAAEPQASVTAADNSESASGAETSTEAHRAVELPAVGTTDTLAMEDVSDDEDSGIEPPEDGIDASLLMMDQSIGSSDTPESQFSLPDLDIEGRVQQTETGELVVETPEAPARASRPNSNDLRTSPLDFAPAAASPLPTDKKVALPNALTSLTGTTDLQQQHWLS